MDEGERPGAEPEFLHASPRALAKEVGDESLIAEAVAAVGARLGANYRITAGKGRQWGKRKEFVIDSQNRRWERWERGTRGPKGGSGLTAPALNLNWTQWKALQLAIYCAKRVRQYLDNIIAWPCSDASSMPTNRQCLHRESCPLRTAPMMLTFSSGMQCWSIYAPL